jgi:hypothetical protein
VDKISTARRINLARRVTAAKALGGFTSINGLATAADIPVDRLRDLASGWTTPTEHEIARIARAARVPVPFFTADLRAVEWHPDAGQARDHGPSLERRIDVLGPRCGSCASGWTPTRRREPGSTPTP